MQVTAKKRSNAFRKTPGERIFDFINGFILVLLCIVTLYPMWYVIVASVSSISHVTNSVVLLWPDGLHWDAYQQVFRNNLVPTAYANTIFITLMGTVISMLLTGRWASLSAPMSWRSPIRYW